MEQSPTNLTLLGHCSDFYSNYFLKSPAKGTYLIISVFIVVINMLLCLVGTPANALIIVAYCRNRGLRTTHNTLLVLVAVTDLLVTSVNQLLYVVIKLSNIFGTFGCPLWNINNIILLFTLTVSLLTNCILSLERFITLAYPFRYQTIVTLRRLKIAVASSWLSLLFMAIVHTIFRLPQVVTGLVAAIALFAMVTVVSSWTWTIRLIRRHRNVIATTQTPSSTGRESVAAIKTLRSTTTALMIVGSLLVCFFPAMITLVYAMIQENLNLTFYFLIRPWVLTLMLANSAVNPCLVLWRNRDVRETAKNLFQQSARRQASIE